jgi:uncharacterized protein YbaA (DUF1428 family)
MSYLTGFLVPVKIEDKDRYIESARTAWPMFQRYGCIEHVEAWGEGIPEGTLTSFPLAVKQEPGEVVVFSWLRWPDKATADAAWEKMTNDPEMQNMDMPFDGKRMMWGGFEIVFQS